MHDARLKRFPEPSDRSIQRLGGLLLLLWSASALASCGTARAVATIPPLAASLQGPLVEPCSRPAWPEGNPPTEAALLDFAVRQEAALAVCEEKRAGAVNVAREAMKPRLRASRLRGFLQWGGK